MSVVIYLTQEGVYGLYLDNNLTYLLSFELLELG